MNDNELQGNKLRKLIFVAIFVALGLVLSPLLVINLGFAKAFPVQHMINVFIAVFFGISYNVGASFVLSSLRILLGVGSLLAYPGSMIGAFISAVVYRQTKSVVWACVGEIIGTGIIGGYVAYLVAAFVLGSKVGAMGMIIPFLTSSFVGAVLAGVIIRVLPKEIKDLLAR